MKKALLMIVGLFCAVAITASAQNAPKKQLTPEQKALQKKMVEKYDTNKDGKLDKEERAKISAEDLEKMKEAGIGGGNRKKAQ